MLETIVFHLFIDVGPDGLLDNVGPASFESFPLFGEFFLFPAESFLLTNVSGTEESLLGANNGFS